MANISVQTIKGSFIGWTDTATYHPFDYDPEKVKKLNFEEKMHKKRIGRWHRTRVHMRMILPFTFICTTCGNANYTGKKLNMDMRPVLDDYKKQNRWVDQDGKDKPAGDRLIFATKYGMQLWRFFAHCAECSSNVVFRTDPDAPAGYVMESGGRRTHDAAAEQVSIEDAERAEKERLANKEQMGEMEYLEERAREARLQMLDSERLQDLIDMKTGSGTTARGGGYL